MEENYIKITKDIYLSSDNYNYILNKRAKDKEGNFVYRPYAYYTRIDTLYNALVRQAIRDDIQILNNLKKCDEMMKMYCENLKFALSKINLNKDDSEENNEEDGI